MSVFEPWDKNLDFAASEERRLACWKERGIFAKQLAWARERAQAEGHPTYVFYEGPPTANGLPHPGHVLTRVVKDLFPRFRAMRGFDVPRKAGWDTHGLPVEIEVEKELGIEGKQGIEDYGVQEFVTRCRESVFRYKDAWTRMTERIGFWIDLDDPYVTYEESYIESVWWSLKRFWDAGLLYHGHKIVPWCPRCGTALSSHEVGQGYKEVAETSAYVAFADAKDPKRQYLAWTTTPWTLPANVGLAVGADHDYVEVKVGDDTLVMAAALREKAMGKIPHETGAAFKGRDLVGAEYRPLFDHLPPPPVSKGAPFRILAGDFVGLDAGSGIVHIAPAFGEDDHRLGRENGLPLVNPVQPDGHFVHDGSPWAGMFVKDADAVILKHLKHHGRLLRTEMYTHDYPFCWRCPTPLLYYPRPAWYIATSTLKDKLLANNRAIQWHPEHIRDGRFGKFLESNVDWALSRERYWGTPLPIWVCECGWKTCVGGKDELLSLVEDPAAIPDDFELHKPWVDAILIPCPKCSRYAHRVPEVIDCWYDSGAMPFAQWGYPYQDGSREKLEAALPADFISEAIDQTRGWFYSLLAIATLLKECADRDPKADELAPWRKDYPLPYRRCLVLGLLLAKDGTKLSKSLRNYPETNEVLDAEGADAMRWFLYSQNQPWTSTRYFREGIREAQKDYLVRLRNVCSFFAIYAAIDGFDPADGNPGARGLSRGDVEAARGYVPLAERSLLDRWMASKTERATEEVTRRLEEMNVLAAAEALRGLVDGLSNWYVRRSRDRFWRGNADADKRAAYWTLFETLARVATLTAPFTPFFAEEVYQKIVRAPWPESLPESVHLCPWPAPDRAALAPDVERQMDLVREVASLGLAARAAQKLKVRQPLAEAVVVLADPALRAGTEELADVIREELNVKKITFADDAEKYVFYSVKPDFQRLGKTLGPMMKPLAAALAKRDPSEVVRAARATGSYTLRVELQDVTLAEADLVVRLTARDGFAAAAGPAGVVVVDATVTEVLAREGLARELVNRVQNFRKDLDLPFEARIALRVGAGGPVARAAVEYADLVAGETLASDYKPAFEELAHTFDTEVGGESVRISIAPVE